MTIKTERASQEASWWLTTQVKLQAGPAVISQHASTCFGHQSFKKRDRVPLLITKRDPNLSTNWAATHLAWLEQLVFDAVLFWCQICTSCWARRYYNISAKAPQPQNPSRSTGQCKIQDYEYSRRKNRANSVNQVLSQTNQLQRLTGNDHCYPMLN